MIFCSSMIDPGRRPALRRPRGSHLTPCALGKCRGTPAHRAFCAPGFPGRPGAPRAAPRGASPALGRAPLSPAPRAATRPRRRAPRAGSGVGVTSGGLRLPAPAAVGSVRPGGSGSQSPPQRLAAAAQFTGSGSDVRAGGGGGLGRPGLRPPAPSLRRSSHRLPFPARCPTRF